MRYIITLFLFVLLFSSCEKKANIEVPELDPELVVAGFIAPHTDTLRLKLTWTTPIYNHTYGTDDDLIKEEENADVSFIYNGNIIKLNYDTTERSYLALNTNYNIGDEVELKIKYNDHAELTSTTIIPAEPKFDIKYIGIKTINYGDYTQSYTQNPHPTTHHESHQLGCKKVKLLL